MTNGWLSLQVRPSYGQKKVWVTWHLDSTIQDAEIYLYVSRDGLAPWELLNETPLQYVDCFEFDDFTFQSTLLVPHFRALARHSTGDFPSPTIGAYDAVQRHEYGIVGAIMGQEFSRMRAGNGIPMYLLPPLNDGTVAPGVDELTGQKQVADCPNDFSTEQGYGRQFSGGFGTPLLTWVELYGSKMRSMTDTPEIGASRDQVQLQARFLAFPKPVRGYLLASNLTDNRYVVGETVESFLFRGIAPVAHQVQVTLLNREDVRYKIPLPELPAL